MTTRIFKPIYLFEEDGELGRLPDGGILNAGGVVGPTFTVGGRGLLFDDGTSTNPTPGTGFTLDVAYSNSTTPATINLTPGKDIVFDAVNSKKFIFDADTGTVTIEGDLNVLGQSNVIEGTISNLDQVNIRPPLPTTVGFTLQPYVGITPTVNLFEVAAVAGGPLVFSIGPTGTTYITDLVAGSVDATDVSITGTINGVDIDDITSHVNAAVTPSKHTAEQISVDDSTMVNISGADVQSAFESIDSQLVTLGTGNVTGFEYIQNTPSLVWAIAHGVGSVKVQATIWDETNSSVLPDAMTIVDGNTVFITFGSPQAGRAILMLF